MTISNSPSAIYAAPQSGTVASSTLFQSALAANTLRRGGYIVAGASTLYVFFGIVANATRAKSLPLGPGAVLSLDLGMGNGFVYQGAIAVGGTLADTFGTNELT